MTPEPAPVRFDEAFDRARQLLRERAAEIGGRIVLIRDVQGRIAVLADAPRDPRTEALARELAQNLGPFGGSADEILLSPKDFFEPERIFQSPDARRLFEPRIEPRGAEGPSNVLLLERGIVGLDWMRPPLAPPDAASGPEPPRVAFFSLKGGVGRSTALVFSARALARAGARVLVFDLDLESPGLGPLLLPRARVPTFGIVDYLVEEAVGQDDSDLLANMVETSPLVAEGAGQIRVVPAGGARGQYLAKLGRAYQPAASASGARELAERVDAMIHRLATQERADVVLLDSRAGLHDIAAFIVTRLRAQALLFGVATEQTWQDYRLLFDDWRSHPELETFRDSLRMVAALVPETERDAYMQRYIEASYGLFADTLYEQAEPRDPQEPEELSGDLDAFNFGLRDETAPHYPLVLYWSRAIQEFDPMNRPGAVTDDQIVAAAGAFCRALGDLLGREVRM